MEGVYNEERIEILLTFPPVWVYDEERPPTSLIDWKDDDNKEQKQEQEGLV